MGDEELCVMLSATSPVVAFAYLNDSSIVDQVSGELAVCLHRKHCAKDSVSHPGVEDRDAGDSQELSKVTPPTCESETCIELPEEEPAKAQGKAVKIRSSPPIESCIGGVKDLRICF